jgi:hypothetical protein
MNGAIMFCAIAAMVALLTAGLWFGLANWLRAGPKRGASCPCCSAS